MPKHKSKQIINKIIEMRLDGMKIKTIARKLKIHPDTARRYCHFIDGIVEKLNTLDPTKMQEALQEFQAFLKHLDYSEKKQKQLEKMKWRLAKVFMGITVLAKIIEWIKPHLSPHLSKDNQA